MWTLYNTSVRELINLALTLERDAADKKYARYLISVYALDKTSEVPVRFLDDTIVNNLIQAGRLLEHVADRLRCETDEKSSADPTKLRLRFNILFDMQCSSAPNISQTRLLNAANNETPYRPHASDMIGPAPNQTQYRQQPPNTVSEVPGQPPRPQAPKTAGAVPTQGLHRCQSSSMMGVAPSQLPHLQALDMAVAAPSNPLHLPPVSSIAGAAPSQLPRLQVSNKAGPAPNQPLHLPPVSNMAGTAPDQFSTIPQSPNMVLEVPIQCSYGLQASHSTNAVPVTDSRGQAQTQPSNLGRSTQIINQEPGRPQSAKSENLAQDGSLILEKPHSASPAQVTHQNPGNLRNSDMFNGVSIKDFACKQTPVRLQSGNAITTDFSNRKRGGSQFSTLRNAASCINLTGEPTPNGPASQALNLESDRTQMAGMSHLFKEIVIPPQGMYGDPLDTEPNTPISPLGTSRGEHRPPGRFAGEVPAQGRAMPIHAGQENLTPDTTVVNETEGGGLQGVVQVQDIPKASKTRKRKRAGTEDTMPATRSRRPVRGR
jgi:hypothetical protein